MNKSNPRSNFEISLKEIITFSSGDPILNEEVRVAPIVLEVDMTQKGVDKCTVKRDLVDTDATRNILYSSALKKWG